MSIRACMRIDSSVRARMSMSSAVPRTPSAPGSVNSTSANTSKKLSAGYGLPCWHGTQSIQASGLVSVQHCAGIGPGPSGSHAVRPGGGSSGLNGQLHAP